MSAGSIVGYINKAIIELENYTDMEDVVSDLKIIKEKIEDYFW